MRKIFILMLFLSTILTTNLQPLYADITFDRNNILIRYDVITLHLLNGLYLSKKQMQEYLQILKNYEKLHTKMDSDLKNIYLQQNLAFAKYRSALINNKGMPKNTEKNAQALEQKMKEIIIAHCKDAEIYDKQLQSLLTTNQLAVVNNFIPCIIPPDSFKDPTRIGQVRSNEDIKKGLADLRKMNQLVYLVTREYWLHLYYEHFETHLKVLSPKDKKAERQRLFKIMDETRKLSAVDFEMKKDDLAQQVTAKAFGEINNHKKYEPTLVGKVLLNVNMIPILEERLAKGG